MIHSHRAWMLFGALTLTSVASTGACGDNRGFADPGTGSFDVDAAAADGASCNTTRCSRDLKSILSGCSDDVVEQCAPGLGCGDGKCVEACRVAELARGSAGCGFWTLPPDDEIENSAGSCLAAMIANTWDTPVTLGAEYGAEKLDIAASTYLASNDAAGAPVYQVLSGPLVPGAVALVFLASRPGASSECPTGVKPAMRVDPITHGTNRTKAFHITTDAPVSAYSIYPYGGASTAFPSATLLLPTTSWTGRYLAVNALPPIANQTKPFLQVVANEDDTVVSVTPVQDIQGGSNLAGAQRGFAQSWTLARGEVLQITQYSELTGSPISANKPIGLFGGTQCTNVPEVAYGYCDILDQQIPPLEQWGSEYALVPYRPRVGFGDGMDFPKLESVPWRLVGAANGTVLTYDPAPPLGAPMTLEAGQALSFATDALVTVRSQDDAHSFYAAQYMTGELYSSVAGGRNLGDPDFVNVVPSQQFLDRYVFFADHTYAETTLTVVRRKTDKGFMPVVLECGGELADFRPLGTKGDYEYTWLRLTKDHQPQSFAKGACGYGRHEASSDGPFGIYVWGTDDAASYGYAGGTGLRALNTIVPEAPR